jgi:aconitate hydratase
MNTFDALRSLNVDGTEYQYYSLDALASEANLERLPYSLKILLENLLRHEDGVNITREDILALANWDAKAEPSIEIAFTPARVLMQDFTGVPAIVDLAAMRDAMQELGGDPNKINPLSPADLVIDHSVMVDNFGTPDALVLNTEREYERNAERYAFLKWGQQAFKDFRVVPPSTGIVHQVNLENLAPVVFKREQADGSVTIYPDTVVGTDSHTTMINGVGVLGWGVGGIEAEAAMLGQPITMLIPQVIGFRLSGKMREGVTATDLVLTIVEMLRQKGVVGKFVEFYGDGLDDLSLADQATVANMAPEYGATCGIFPVDQAALDYLYLSGRSEEQIALVEAYTKVQGMYRESGATEAEYSDTLSLDMSTVQPSIAGPKRPQDRIELKNAKWVILDAQAKISGSSTPRSALTVMDGVDVEMHDGDIVIAAITSCTNTSNPSVMMASGLLAQKAVELGLEVKPWVKTSLAPGSRVVTEYLQNAGLIEPLDALGFDVVGYGCTTCIGNSGPLPAPVVDAIHKGDLVVSSVLSGNRNFEGRVHSEVKMNFLASPPLVVAYALAGTTSIDLNNEPLGQGKDGQDVYMRDIWPSQLEVNAAINSALSRDMFIEKYKNVFKGDERWQAVKTTPSKRFNWNKDSSYIQQPPYFEGITMTPPGFGDIKGARVLVRVGDSITTDHISPAGAIKADSPAGAYLSEAGVHPSEYNSYGSRRGNHEVMMRGTFANIRLRNELAPGTEGGWTAHQPDGEVMSIFHAAEVYRQANTPLMIIAGKEYGTGSSRDWAAKGVKLLGVKAVLVESFERIHRSNLVGMGVLPLQFNDGDTRETLRLDGTESYDILGVVSGAKQVTIKVTNQAGEQKSFDAKVRIDTPKEWEYYDNGGILDYVLRQLAG